MSCTSADLTTYDYFASVGNSTLSRNFESTLNRHKGHRVSSKRHNEVVRPAHLCFLSIILPHQRGTSPNKLKMTKKKESWKGAAAGTQPVCVLYITNSHEEARQWDIIRRICRMHFYQKLTMQLQLSWHRFLLFSWQLFRRDHDLLEFLVHYRLNAIWRQYRKPRTLESGHPALKTLCSLDLTL